MVALSAFSACNLLTRRTSRECDRVSIQWKCGTSSRNQPELASVFKGGGKSLGIPLFRTVSSLVKRFANIPPTSSYPICHANLNP